MRVSSASQRRLALAASLVMAACGGANHSSADAGGAAGGHEGGATSSGGSAATGGSAGTAGAASSAGHSGGGASAGHSSSGGDSGGLTGTGAGGHASAGTSGAGGSIGSGGVGGAHDANGGTGGGAGRPATGGGTGGSAGVVAINCSYNGQLSFPDFSRSCQVASDCVLATHDDDCCGDFAVTAIAASAKPAFDAAESICLSQYPHCNCLDAQWLDVEDGTRTARSRQSQVIASCDAGSCKAHYTGATFACGNHGCTDLEYCRITSSGDAGTASSYACQQTKCMDCNCLANVSQGCHCSLGTGAAPWSHLPVTGQKNKRSGGQ